MPDIIKFFSPFIIAGIIFTIPALIQLRDQRAASKKKRTIYREIKHYYKNFKI